MNAKVKEITDGIIYATIGTVDANGQPWNSPVFSAVDESLHVFWGSHHNSQHSKNIRDTGKAFIVIYDSTKPAGEGEGVYIKASVQELSDPLQIKEAHALLQNRRPIPYWKLEQVQPPAPVRLYKATPERVWLNGESEVDDTYIDILKEVQV